MQKPVMLACLSWDVRLKKPRPILFLVSRFHFVELCLSRMVNIKHLAVQCSPNLLWGQFDKNLHVMVVKHL